MKKRSQTPEKARKLWLGVEPLEERTVPATFAVTTFADVVSRFDGVTSLREAIRIANGVPGADTIELQAGTYGLTRAGDDNTAFRGDLDITESVTIVGKGDGTTVIDARNGDRLFEVHGAVDARFADLALTHGGNANSDGGAVQALSANITLEGVTALLNFGSNGGAINVESGNATIRSSKLVTNQAGFNGGAIRVGTGKLFIDRSTVDGNIAALGGGIFTDQAKVTAARSDVLRNTANGGGGIHSQGGMVVLSNTFVQQNAAAGDGGGVFVLGTLNADSSRILNNQSGTSGGGVAAITANFVRSHVSGNRTDGFGGGVSAGSARFRSTDVVANTAVGDGSGMYILGGLARLADSRVLSNESTQGAGGGIAATNVLLERSIVSANRSHLFGGGISAPNASLFDSTVSENVAGGDGGGMYVFGGRALVVRSSVDGNESVEGGGGGIAATRATLVGSNVRENLSHLFGGGLSAVDATLISSTVSGNVALGDGGGMYVFGGLARLIDSTVHGNVSREGGGGGIAATIATLTRSTISGNQSQLFGGGLSAQTATLVNSTVSGNLAGGDSGGIHIEQGGGKIVNSTIAFNHAAGHGGGVNNRGAAVQVKNTIIARNTADESGQDVFGLFDSLGHNLVEDPVSHNANTDFSDPLNADILFVNPKLDTLADNGGRTHTHRLLAGSQAIDHGDNGGAPATDQRGVTRPRDGDANGSLIVDIGAFEV